MSKSHRAPRKQNKQQNAIKATEDGIRTIFTLKEKAAIRDAFDNLLPFHAKSAEIRKSLTQLERQHAIPEDERATKCIVELSNAVHPFLHFLDERQYEQLNKCFGRTVDHIVRLEHKIVHPPPMPEYPEPPPELETILDNNEVLKRHIESLEGQVWFVKDSKRKIQEEHAEKVRQLEKINANLRNSLQQTQEESEVYRQEYLEKEKSLQLALVHLSTAQEELKRVKFDMVLTNKTTINGGSSNAAMESFQRHSKYSAKEFVRLNAALDAMRAELHRERIERTYERDSLKSALAAAEGKLNFSEVVIAELRDTARNVSASQLNETANFNASLSFMNNDSRLHGGNSRDMGRSRFGPNSSSVYMGMEETKKGADIDHLHATTVTLPDGTVTQSPKRNPNTNVSRLSSGRFSPGSCVSPQRAQRASSSLLNDSPSTHALPRGASYIAVETGNSVEYLYKEPFVVRAIELPASASLPLPRKRSSSAEPRLRGRNYASLTSTDTLGQNHSFSASSVRSGGSPAGRSRSSSAHCVRSLRGRSSTGSPLYQLSSNNSSASDVSYIKKFPDVGASKHKGAILSHPMYRSLTGKHGPRSATGAADSQNASIAESDLTADESEKSAVDGSIHGISGIDRVNTSVDHISSDSSGSGCEQQSTVDMHIHAQQGEEDDSLQSLSVSPSPSSPLVFFQQQEDGRLDNTSTATGNTSARGGQRAQPGSRASSVQSPAHHFEQQMSSLQGSLSSNRVQAADGPGSKEYRSSATSPMKLPNVSDSHTNTTPDRSSQQRPALDRGNAFRQSTTTISSSSATKSCQQGVDREEEGGVVDDDISDITPEVGSSARKDTASMSIPQAAQPIGIAATEEGKPSQSSRQSVLDALYEQIQLLKETHLSPVKQTRNAQHPASELFPPETGDGENATATDTKSFLSAHAENLAAIQTNLRASSGDLHEHSVLNSEPRRRGSGTSEVSFHGDTVVHLGNDVFPVYGTTANIHSSGGSRRGQLQQGSQQNKDKYADLVREYNELMALYVQEMRKNRDVRAEFRDEICDSTNNIAALQDEIDEAAREQERLRHQLADAQEDAHSRDVQQKAYTTELELQISVLNLEVREKGDRILALEEDSVHRQQVQRPVGLSDMQQQTLAALQHKLDHLAAGLSEQDVDHAIEHAKRDIHNLLHSRNNDTSGSTGTGRHSEKHATRASHRYSESSRGSADGSVGSTSTPATAEQDARNDGELTDDLVISLKVASLKTVLDWTVTQKDNIHTTESENRRVSEDIRSQTETIRDQTRLLDVKDETIRALQQQLSDAERARSSASQLTSQVDSETERLKTKLEQTMRELQEAQDRHTAGNDNNRGIGAPLLLSHPTANKQFHLASSDLPPPHQGSRSPATSVRTGDHTSVGPTGNDISGYYDDLQYISREHVVNSTTTDNYLDGNMHGHPPMHDRGSVASSYSQPQRASASDPRLFHSYDSGSSSDDHGGGGFGNVIHNQRQQSRNLAHTQAQTPPLQPQYQNSEHLVALQTQSKEFECRALTAEMKCDLLARQIQSMPASLSVSLAEKRVLECKLNKTLIAHDLAIQQIEADNLHQIRELQAFLKLEKSEKLVLQDKLRDQSTTIHQLTHHLKLVTASRHAEPERTPTFSSTYIPHGSQGMCGSFDRSFRHQQEQNQHEGRSIRVSVPPAPWEAQSPVRVTSSRSGVPVDSLIR